jgi:hypothetical protein
MIRRQCFWLRAIVLTRNRQNLGLPNPNRERESAKTQSIRLNTQKEERPCESRAKSREETHAQEARKKTLPESGGVQNQKLRTAPACLPGQAVLFRRSGPCNALIALPCCLYPRRRPLGPGGLAFFPRVAERSHVRRACPRPVPVHASISNVLATARACSAEPQHPSTVASTVSYQRASRPTSSGAPMRGRP